MATLIFTTVRAKAGPLVNAGVFEHENVVRARIVTPLEQLVALRDMLNKAIQESPARGGVGSYTLN
ncbi:hypothetical protein [Bradyrhizobium sp.]|uniref:hypothetical protein n=1 Tax=Bradyrhizobium sp. TaxID=376 RepID=UPI004037F112